jgi:spore coat polysaccharide biosynthesis protein SpsF
MSGQIPVILQARMSSGRLPGKMLLSVGGRILFDRVVERCRQSREISEVIVATSSDPSDNALAERCASQGLKYHRGPLLDVAERFASAVRFARCEAFVRICGDSPFIDPALIDQAVVAYRGFNVDLVTNTFPRTFPKGVSVEVVRAQAFFAALPRMTAAGEREHVTAVFYRLAGEFRIHGIRNDEDLSGENLCVDTAADLERIDAAFKTLGPRASACGWREALAAVREAQLS